MKQAGYSGTPLVQKLGYKTGETVYSVQVPQELKDELARLGVVIVNHLPATWGHAFFEWQTEVEAFLSATELNKIEKGLWVSWPKKAAKVPTDLTEQSFRNQILPLGWVDIKVAAVDDTWSGLKFTRRKK